MLRRQPYFVGAWQTKYGAKERADRPTARCNLPSARDRHVSIAIVFEQARAKSVSNLACEIAIDEPRSFVDSGGSRSDFARVVECGRAGAGIKMSGSPIGADVSRNR
jgi:hypothetical protein